MGTLINVVLIVLGGFCGLIFGKRLKPQVQDSLMLANGVAVLFLAIGGVMTQMLSEESGILSQNSGYLAIGLVIVSSRELYIPCFSFNIAA